MLRSLKDIEGFSITAKNGPIGHVHDFYFDDEHWTIRYMIADTGHWLTGRLVLISPVALHSPEWDERNFPVELTREEIEAGPGIDSDRTVTREHEIGLYRLYGWPNYWASSAMPGILGPYPELVLEPDEGSDGTGTGLSSNSVSAAGLSDASEQNHLQSTRSVTGYKVHATDGSIGHVEDFVVDEETWQARYMVVDTHDWLPGKKVLVSPDWINEVNWASRQINVTLSRGEVADAPAFHHVAEIDKDYEKSIRDYYELCSTVSRVGRRPSKAG